MAQLANDDMVSLFFVIEPIEGASVLGLGTSRRDAEALADCLRTEYKMGSWAERFWSELHEDRIWFRSLAGQPRFHAIEIVRMEVGEPHLSQWLDAVSSGRPARASNANEDLLRDATAAIHEVWDRLVDDALRDLLNGINSVVMGLREESADPRTAADFLDAVAGGLAKIRTDRYPSMFTSELQMTVKNLATELRGDDVDAMIDQLLEIQAVLGEHADFLTWLRDQ